mmetsp:Transcript_61684/g.75633  ORF Transcript_61684/g.75633 Transcript_61684/m.75633 type:complete len:224 (-) Transcript_61684:18-689(-)
MTLKTFFLISLIHYGTSLTGIDLAGTYDDFTCLKQSIEFIITRAWHSYGAFDSTSITNLKNAQNAGFGLNSTDVYFFPCTTTGRPTATEQMTYMINNLTNAGAQYGMIWLDIEGNPKSTCSWSQYSDTTNCNFIQELTNTAVKMGKKVGIYSSKGEWESIVFSSVKACPEVGIYPLWYAHYDKQPNFDDWSVEEFGGWTQPTIKQYTDDQRYCNTAFDGDYRP